MPVGRNLDAPALIRTSLVGTDLAGAGQIDTPR
jgi:hypothetical protein